MFLEYGVTDRSKNVSCAIVVRIGRDYPKSKTSGYEYLFDLLRALHNQQSGGWIDSTTFGDMTGCSSHFPNSRPQMTGLHIEQDLDRR